MNYAQLEKVYGEKVASAMNKAQVFWAFSSEQFTRELEKLPPETKLISIGHGGFMPKENFDQFESDLKEYKAWFQTQVLANNLKEAQIKHELYNHECFYTGDLEEVYELFKGTYSQEEIDEVYYKIVNAEG